MIKGICYYCEKDIIKKGFKIDFMGITFCSKTCYNKQQKEDEQQEYNYDEHTIKENVHIIYSAPMYGLTPKQQEQQERAKQAEQQALYIARQSREQLEKEIQALKDKELEKHEIRLKELKRTLMLLQLEYDEFYINYNIELLE